MVIRVYSDEVLDQGGLFGEGANSITTAKRIDGILDIVCERKNERRCQG